MAKFKEVRVAAVQATPVVLDAEASIAKAVRLIGEAAAGGAELVVLPETFVSLYPSNAWAAVPAAGFGGADELWERMWASSVDVPGTRGRRARCGLPHAWGGVRDRGQRARVRASGHALQHAVGDLPATVSCTVTAS